MSFYVKPISALLTHDTQLFSNMDPYVVIKIGREKKKTSTHKEGGKKPKWNEVFTFRPQSTDQMEITVYDQDTFTDDLVGTARVSISGYMDGEEKKQYISLLYKGKSAGKIYMSMRYLSDQNSNNSFQTQPKGWGAPVQGHSAWGQPPANSWGQPPPVPQSGWGANNNGWGQPPQGWGQQPQKTQGTGGWGQKPPQNYSAWANNTNGWNQQQPNNNSNWGNPPSPAQNNSGWGNQPSQPQNNNGWGNNPSNNSNSDQWTAPSQNNNVNNGWGNKPPQAPQPDLIGLLANVLNNPSGPSNNPPANNNQANNGWGPNNNGWGNPNNNNNGW